MLIVDIILQERVKERAAQTKDTQQFTSGGQSPEVSLIW